MTRKQNQICPWHTGTKYQIMSNFKKNAAKVQLKPIKIFNQKHQCRPQKRATQKFKFFVIFMYFKFVTMLSKIEYYDL